MITSVSPSYAFTPGGRSIIVSGYHFQNLHSVYFGSARSPHVRVVSARQVVATAPRNSAGAMHVHVYTDAGASSPDAAARFTVRTPPPAITGLSYHDGDVHGAVGPSYYPYLKIFGRYLDHATSVAFSRTPARIERDTAGTITVAIPAHAAGLTHVWVYTAGGTSAPTHSAFTYHPSPEIYHLDSSDGPTAGGDRITITGAALAHATTVTFGGVAGTGLVVDGSSRISVTAPRHAVATVPVRIVTSYNSSYTSGRYRYGPASTVHASAPSDIDPDENLTALSCPTTDFCAATDHQNNWLNETAGTWSVPARTAGGAAVSCASATFCMSGSLYLTWEWDGQGWTQVANPFDPADDPFDVQQLVCESSTFCLARGDGKISTWDGTAWSTPVRPLATPSYPGDYVEAISCWAANACGAAAEEELDELDGTGWHVVHGLLDSTPTSVSCADAQVCQVGFHDGSTENMTTTGFVATTDVLPETVGTLQCWSATSCVAVGADTVATWGGSAWSTSTDLPVGPGEQAGMDLGGAVSCPQPRACTAVGAGSAASFAW